MFQLSQLRCFVAVASELHFGRAAALLNMTQPPLTRQIQLLEHELQVQLFDRSGGGVRLTSAGAVFLREAEDILRRAQTATLAARRAMRADIGSVTLAFVPPAGFALLPQLLAVAQQAMPDVHVDLREMQTDDQLEALAANRIDLAIVRPFVPRSFAESSVLIRESLLLAVPVGHPLGVVGPVSLASLEAQPFIEFSPTQSRYLHDVISGRLRAAGISPDVVRSLSHTHTILSLVDAGMGMSLVPRSASRLRYEGIVFRPLLDAPGLEVELHLAWRRNGREAVAERLRSTILDAFAP